MPSLRPAAEPALQPAQQPAQLPALQPAQPDSGAAPKAVGPLPEELLCDPAIGLLLDSVRHHLGCEIAFIARYTQGEAREFTHVSSAQPVAFGPGVCEHRAQSLCWHILEGRLPPLMPDTADFPLPQPLALARSVPVGCHIGVPLRLSDKTIWGSFAVLDRRPDRSLTERDLKIARSFADLAAERIERLLDEARARAEARARVISMLDGQAITIFQQPIHALGSGRPAGVECLARFPNINQRGPAAWFEDAEQVGLGPALEMAAIACAIETLAQVPGSIFAAINASPRLLLSGELRRAIERAAPRCPLVIEVSDYRGMPDPAPLARALDELRPLAAIALDEPGAGFADLHHASCLQPDILKLDLALTRGIDQDAARRAMARILVQAARGMGCKVIAGGIETAGEAAAMRDLGVDYGQGYFFARPLPVAAAQQHLLGIVGD